MFIDLLSGAVGSGLTGLLLVIVAIVVLILLTGIRFIPNNRIGIVEKRFAFQGSVKSGFIALNNEAGYQPEVMRGGLHYLIPIQYRVHTAPLVTIPQGKIGYVFARDGIALDPTQTLASNAVAQNFQDVRSFFKEGEQRVQLLGVAHLDLHDPALAVG